MLYKPIICALVLFVATPVFGQKMSPIVVETGKPVPTVVRSGETFTVTYRAKYTDVVLIMEDQMQLKSISLLEKDEKTNENVAVGNAEVIDLKIGENYREKGVNIQDFIYTFRIVNDKKGSLILSSFDFIWVEKKAGTAESQAQEKQEMNKFPTDEVGIGYVTSVVKPPPLDIRDRIEFESFAERIRNLIWIAYAAIGFSSLTALLVLYRFFRQPKSQKTEAIKGEQKSETDPVNKPVVALSPKQARKKMLRELKKLSVDSELKKNPLALEKELRKLIRAFLVATLSEGPVKVYESDTDHEIFVRFENLDPKQVKQLGRSGHVFSALAKLNKIFQDDIDSGKSPFIYDSGHAQEKIDDLARWIKSLTWRGKLMRMFRKWRLA